MAFVIEDGTGKPDANAYCSVAFADSYFAERSISAWAGSEQTKQSAIIRATDYMDLRFSNSYYGSVSVATQSLSFPRIYPTFPTFPDAVKKACCEYALRALSNPLVADPVVDSTGLGITMTRKKVGPIEKEVRYATTGSGATPSLIRPYPAADMLLRPFLRYSPKRVIHG